MVLSRRSNFKLAYQSLRASKARSLLTMLGIIIGVAAVVLTICIGQGVKEQIAGKLGRYGPDVLAVETVAPDGSPLQGLQQVRTGLAQRDVTVAQKTAGVSVVVPLATATGSMTGDHTVATPSIIATTADFTYLSGQPFASGGMFDTENGSKTVVLGSEVAHRLFDDTAPLGESLTWRGQRFLVAGVFDSFDAPPFSPEAAYDNSVFVPYSTALDISGGSVGLYELLAKTDGTATNLVRDRLQLALDAAHGGAKDTTVFAAARGGRASDDTIHLLTVLIAGAAIIALIVGGVGIMNIMLVNVAERMHEIGIRKAIGATNQQIMRQFVAEAFVLSVIGAVIGLVLSCAAVGLLRLYSSIHAVIVWQVLVIAPLIAIVVGVFFGSMPALKAARKDPIEALRHE